MLPESTAKRILAKGRSLWPKVQVELAEWRSKAAHSSERARRAYQLIRHAGFALLLVVLTLGVFSIRQNLVRLVRLMEACAADAVLVERTIAVGGVGTTEGLLVESAPNKAASEHCKSASDINASALWSARVHPVRHGATVTVPIPFSNWLASQQPKKVPRSRHALIVLGRSDCKPCKEQAPGVQAWARTHTHTVPVIVLYLEAPSSAALAIHRATYGDGARPAAAFWEHDSSWALPTTLLLENNRFVSACIGAAYQRNNQGEEIERWLHRRSYGL